MVSKILIASSDLGICSFVTHYLLEKNYEVRSIADPESASVACEHFKPDLVIIDDNLPDRTTEDLCQFLKTRTSTLVLRLTTTKSLEDNTKCLWQGCDDFMLKSFDAFLLELECRVKVLCSRREDVATTKTPILVADNLAINLICREVTVNKQKVALTTLEFDLLYYLANSPGRVWRRDELIQKVWHSNYIGNTRLVDIHIGNLRRKLNSASALIQTVKGIGYKFSTCANA
jgi:DNA-binding response OmpR family regulator